MLQAMGSQRVGHDGATELACHLGDVSPHLCLPVSQVKEAMQRIHDRGNIGKLILDVEKTPTPLVSQRRGICSLRQERVFRGRHTCGGGELSALSSLLGLVGETPGKWVRD